MLFHQTHLIGEERELQIGFLRKYFYMDYLKQKKWFLKKYEMKIIWKISFVSQRKSNEQILKGKYTHKPLTLSKLLTNEASKKYAYQGLFLIFMVS